MSEVSQERRRHARFEWFCLIDLHGETGQLIASTQTINVSDGGALVLVPSNAAPAVGSVLNVRLQVRSTSYGSNPTRQFNSQARVVRHEDSGQADRTAVAIEFHEPLKLGLE